MSFPGSVQSGEDVLKFQDVGLVNALTLHSLTMQDGHVYYATVRGKDNKQSGGARMGFSGRNDSNFD